MKSEEKQDKGDFTYQGPSNRSLGGWSHDQLPKMVRKTNIVALHCSFLNLVKLCSEVLLWRYEVKEFEKCCDFFFVFFLFFFFFFFAFFTMKTKQNNMISTHLGS